LEALALEALALEALALEALALEVGFVESTTARTRPYRCRDCRKCTVHRDERLIHFYVKMAKKNKVRNTWAEIPHANAMNKLRDVLDSSSNCADYTCWRVVKIETSLE